MMDLLFQVIKNLESQKLSVVFVQETCQELMEERGMNVSNTSLT